MSTKQTYSRFHFYKAWFKAHRPGKKEVLAAISISLGCVVIGLVGLRLPEHKAYHAAVVRHVGVRHGSKQPGARVRVELPNGRQVFVQTRAYVSGLKSGSQICVQELKDMLWGSTFYRNALPQRCQAAGL